MLVFRCEPVEPDSIANLGNVSFPSYRQNHKAPENIQHVGLILDTYN